jgi:hypothetical protein
MNSNEYLCGQCPIFIKQKPAFFGVQQEAQSPYREQGYLLNLALDQRAMKCIKISSSAY